MLQIYKQTLIFSLEKKINYLVFLERITNVYFFINFDNISELFTILYLYDTDKI